MRYHNITKDDMLNGEGLRVVLWVAGCSHGCPGCHNPITWDEEGGLPFDEAAHDELFSLLERDYVSGLTLSGGDPLHVCNREGVEKLCREMRERLPEKTIWLYTGYCWEDIADLPLLENVDVLVDGPYIEAERSPQLPWRGSSNQRLIDVQETLHEGKIILHPNPTIIA